MENQDWAVGLTEQKAAYMSHILINQLLCDQLGIEPFETIVYNKKGEEVARG